MSSPRKSSSGSGEEWTYLAIDLEENCPACGSALRAGQAAGNVDGVTVHAKCYDEWKGPRPRPA